MLRPCRFFGVVGEPVDERSELFRFLHGEVVQGVGGIGGELCEIVEIGGRTVQECFDCV